MAGKLALRERHRLVVMSTWSVSGESTQSIVLDVVLVLEAALLFDDEEDDGNEDELTVRIFPARSQERMNYGPV